jgi:hypothetical protein
MHDPWRRGAWYRFDGARKELEIVQLGRRLRPRRSIKHRDAVADTSGGGVAQMGGSRIDV